jgi:hypothetical protein
MVDAGWFTDPESSSQLRWWDGQRWTEHRHAAAQTPAVVAPTVVTTTLETPAAAQPVWSPPHEIYPAPAPLAMPYPPPSTDEPIAVEPTATAASTPAQGSATTATYWHTPEPPPHSSRNLLLAVLIPVGTLILILIAFIIVNIAEGATASSPKAIAAPSPKSALAPPDISQPGMVGAFSIVTAGGRTTTAAAASEDEFLHYSNEQMGVHCSPLAFGAPVDGFIPDSKDQVTFYTNFLSPSGGTSMSGAVQVFPSSSRADDYLNRLTGLIAGCAGGFPDGDGTDTVTLAPGKHVSMEHDAWNQSVITSSRSYTVHSIEWRKGNIVARSWCYQIAGTADSSDICGQWASEVQSALRNSH